MHKRGMILVFGALVTAAAFAQAPSITVGDLTCLPNEDNAALTAAVEPEVGGASVRLYFRRLNPVGAAYYDEMIAAGEGDYWSVFPKPEEREQEELTDEWWDVLKDRDWMDGHDRDWLEDWLDEQDHEAAEYFVAVHDAQGNRLSESEIMLVPVLDGDDCEVSLTEHEFGWSHNLTVGETTEIQAGKQVFHWLCDGVVTRIGSNDVLRADEYCRACVVGLIPTVLPMVGIAAGVVAVSIIEHPPTSPTQPTAPQ